MTPDLLEKQSEPMLSSGEDDVRQYLNEIRQYPRLSYDQERELAARCAQGDEDAIRHMVGSNLRLVVSVAREYAGRGVPLLDLIQEGSIGLLVAARKYDYTLDYRFSTYATKWIRQGVTRCLMNHSQLIRVPVHTAEQIRKVEAARSSLRTSLAMEPTLAQIGEKCGMSESRVAKLLQLTPETCSLDAPTGEGEEGTLSALLEDLHAPQPQEELIRRELEHTMQTLMDTLNDRQKYILQHHFGLADGNCCSLEQIAASLGISKERVRQIEKQAMDKLQKQGTSLGLEDFLA